MIPLTVEESLKKELTTFIDSGDFIDLFSLRKYLIKIESIPVYSRKKMMEGLAYAAAGSFDKANEAFRLALQTNDPIVIGNYLTYLVSTYQIKEYMLEVIRFSHTFDNITALHVALYYAVFFLNHEKSKEINERILKVKSLSRGDPEYIVNNYRYFAENIGLFMSIGNLNNDDVDWMNNQIIDICKKNKTTPLFIQHYVDNHDSDVAFITTIDSSDPELLSELSYNLAMSIAENDKFLLNGITGWFKGIDSSEVIPV